MNIKFWTSKIKYFHIPKIIQFKMESILKMAILRLYIRPSEPCIFAIFKTTIFKYLRLISYGKFWRPSWFCLPFCLVNISSIRLHSIEYLQRKADIFGQLSDKTMLDKTMKSRAPFYFSKYNKFWEDLLKIHYRYENQLNNNHRAQILKC
jgi:hypothetical protein